MDNHLDKARDGMARHKDGRLMTYEEYAAELAWPYEAPTTAERLKRCKAVLKAVARSQGRKM